MLGGLHRTHSPSTTFLTNSMYHYTQSQSSTTVPLIFSFWLTFILTFTGFTRMPARDVQSVASKGRLLHLGDRPRRLQCHKFQRLVQVKVWSGGPAGSRLYQLDRRRNSSVKRDTHRISQNVSSKQFPHRHLIPSKTGSARRCPTDLHRTTRNRQIIIRSQR